MKSMPDFTANGFTPAVCNQQSHFNYGYNAEEAIFLAGKKSRNRDKVSDIFRISKDIRKIEYFDTEVLSQRLFEIASLTKMRNSQSNQKESIGGNYKLNSKKIVSN